MVILDFIALPGSPEPHLYVNKNSFYCHLKFVDLDASLNSPHLLSYPIMHHFFICCQ